MLKALIVDDEKITRDSLKEYIGWEELGVPIVETARNGLVALEIAQQLNPPDIILCDIKMPIMDGIEFASKIRELYPDCKIIFLSGYSDKEYLKSAIKLKAISYIDKPINIKEITEILKETIQICNEEKKNKFKSEKINQEHIKNIPFLSQQMTLDLVNYKNNPDELKEKYGDTFSHFFSIKNYIVVCVIFNWRFEISTKEANAIEQNIFQTLYNKISGASSPVNFGHSKTVNDPNKFSGATSTLNFDHSKTVNFLSGFTEKNILTFIFDLPDNPENFIQNDMLSPIKDFLISNSQDLFTVSIGVSKPSNDFSLIPELYLNALTASQMQFYLGVNRIIFHKDILPTGFFNEEDVTSPFKLSLKKGSHLEASDMIRKLTQHKMTAMNKNIDYVKNEYFNLLLVILLVNGENEFTNKIEETKKGYVWREIDNFTTLPELSDYLLSYIEACFTPTSEKDAVIEKINSIKKYIEEHYFENKISIQSIANYAYLSHTYLCAFFKKFTGKTVNEYITEVRIEKSKVYLKDNRIKLYEIAINIGFTDANYFSYLFKKNTGFTPSEFREKFYS